jgi:asparagine synthase (glutamine-hydrolysing)
MCGFVGFVQRTPAPEQLSPMLRRVVHRGPDGEGTWMGGLGEWFVALGHRRLAILDIAGGAQPMATPEGSVQVVYNGELYNFRDLRAELEKRGVEFETRSDTEVLLHHLATHWAQGLSALNGMFAFALWDHARGRLLLARDRVGIKPLYYGQLPDGGIAFASELTALLQHPRMGRRLSAAGLESYFFSDYVKAPLTLVQGANKLPPGHFIEWSEGRMSMPRPYWSLVESRPAVDSGHPKALAAELWSRLGAAVERQMIADVPVGVFLSGGIDSSCVATLAQERSTQALRTFSIAFDDPTFDESDYARKVARRIGSVHIEQRLSEANLLDVVDVALAQLDEPLADPSYLPTFMVSQLAASQVKVVLGGDGGDEVFGGYPTYGAHQAARLYRRLPAVLRHRAMGAMVSRLRERDSYQSLEWKMKRFVLRWDDDTRRRHLRWMSNLDLDDLRKGIAASTGALPSAFDSGLAGFDESLNGLLALDFLTYLPGSVLTKVDRASMAHGLEARPPMLDNEIIDWVFSLPPSLKVRQGRSKFLLKLAAREHLPDEVIDRRKKGFGIPLRTWLRGPLRDRVNRALQPSSLWASCALNRDVFSGWARMLDARQGDYSKALWALVVLDEWVRRERIDSELDRDHRVEASKQ